MLSSLIVASKSPPPQVGVAAEDSGVWMATRSEVFADGARRIGLLKGRLCRNTDSPSESLFATNISGLDCQTLR